MNKPVCLGLSLLELNKKIIYVLWNAYIKPEYGEKSKLCYKDIKSFTVYIKTDDIYKDIAKVVETRQFLKGKNKKFIVLMKDELDGKITTECVALRAKTYIYLKSQETLATILIYCEQFEKNAFRTFSLLLCTNRY